MNGDTVNIVAGMGSLFIESTSDLSIFYYSTIGSSPLKFSLILRPPRVLSSDTVYKCRRSENRSK